MPDLAEQDDRRPVRAPAQRARLVPAPLAALDRESCVVTGPSGVGKGTLIRALRERHPEFGAVGLGHHPRRRARARRTAATTTSSRPRSSSERVQRGEFLEHAEYAGNRYGTLRSEIDRAAQGARARDRDPGRPAGAQALPEALQVFIAPPSIETLRERLTERGTDSPR